MYDQGYFGSHILVVIKKLFKGWNLIKIRAKYSSQLWIRGHVPIHSSKLQKVINIRVYLSYVVNANMTCWLLS